MKKILIRLVIMVGFILGINITTSHARIVTNDPTVESGGTVTINVNSQEVVDGYKVSVSSNSGLTFLSVSGGEVNGQSVAGANVSGTKSLATYKFKAPQVSSDTKYKVVFTAEGVIIHGTTTKTSSSATATVTVKAASNGDTTSKNPVPSNDSKPQNENQPKNEEEQPKEKEPTFKSANDKMYSTGNINVRKSYSADSDKLGTLQKGDSVVRTGIGDNGWSKVSYNGGTGYIKTSLLTSEEPKKSEDKSLKSLTIEGLELVPEFNPETTDYTAVVGDDVEKVDVKAIATDENARVTVQNIDKIEDGDNLIKITVTAEDETTRTYTINVTRNKQEATESIALTSLKVQGYTIDPKFSSEVYEYKITVLDPKIVSLDVTAEANLENAKIEITGNKNINQGENTITIKVSSEDGSETATYRIIVNKTATVAGTTGQSNNTILYGGIGIIALLVIAIIAILIIAKRKERADEEYYEDEEEYEDLYGYSTKNEPSAVRTNSIEENNIDKKELERELFGELPNQFSENDGYQTGANNMYQMNENNKYQDNSYPGKKFDLGDMNPSFNFDSIENKNPYNSYSEVKTDNFAGENDNYFGKATNDDKNYFSDTIMNNKNTNTNYFSGTSNFDNYYSSGANNNFSNDSTFQDDDTSLSNKGDNWNYDDDYKPRRSKGKHSK